MSLHVTIETPTEPAGPSTAGARRWSPTGISVIVVGGGPVGVFTALECWRKGHDVRVLERNPAGTTQGDFFNVAPQVGRHMQSFWPDLAAQNEAISFSSWSSIHKLTGEIVSGPNQFQFTAATEGDAAPPRIYRHNRPKFLRMLIMLLEKVGISIEYGNRVVEYYEDSEKSGIVLADGRRMEADVVVAADGIGTKSHQLINGRDIRAWSSGLAIFRTAFPVDVIVADEEINRHFSILDNGSPGLQIWMGKNLQFFVLRTEDIISWSLMHEDDGAARESWHQSINPETVLETFSHVPEFPDYAKRLIRATPDGGIVNWPLLWRDPQEKTVSPLGRVVQAGDAAHTFLPSSGSGINQGIEDAIYLASCLQMGGMSDVAAATQVYSKLRFERVSCCQKLGFINHQRRNNPNWSEAARDVTLIKSEYGQWIWRHGPEQYVHDNYFKALDQVRNGALFQNTNIPPGYVHESWGVDELMSRIKKGDALEFAGDWE